MTILVYVQLRMKIGRNAMETIYNHGITKNELEKLSSFIPSRYIGNKSEYLKKSCKDLCYADLFHLYVLRNDITKAEYYLKKIKDEKYKFILSEF